MSRQSKKRRRKEEAAREELLAPDAFEAQGATWSSWLEKNLKLVAGALGAVLLTVVAVEIVRSSSEGTAAVHTGELIDAVDAYREAVRGDPGSVATSTGSEGADAALREARAELRGVLDGDGGEDLKALAQLYDADLARRLDAHDAALDGYDAYLAAAGPDDPFRFFALEGKGYAHEARGDLDAAAAVFEEVASMARFGDYGLKHLARVRRAQGDVEAAKAAYEKIVAREPASPLKDFAEQQLGFLD
jgi:hypothetical protein